MQAKALLFKDVDQVELIDIILPELETDEVLIETAYSCISPGTEMRCLSGKQPGLPFPFIPGYAISGTIIARGANTTLQEGTQVFSSGTAKVHTYTRGWGGHVSHAVRRERDIFVLPEGVELLDGSLAKQAAIAYHGLRQSRPQLNDTVAVIGLGLIGQLSARLHTLSGARTVAVDLSNERVNQARTAGVEAYTGEDGLVTTFQRIIPQGADVIIDATGSQQVLTQGITIARELPWDDTLTLGARYIIQGSYADTFAVPYQEAFLKELSFFLPRSDQPRDIRAVLELLGQKKLHVQDLISDVRTPEDAAITYTELRKQNLLLTVAFAWR